MSVAAEIIPGLWIGNWQSAETCLREAGWHVITVACDAPVTGAEKFPLVDGPGNEPALFAAAVEATERAMREQANRVLVHCVSGRSRSGAVIVKTLARLRGWSVYEVYDETTRRYDALRIHPALSLLLLA